MTITQRNIASINNNIKTIAKNFGVMSAQYERSIQGLKGLQIRETTVNGERVVQIRDTRSNRRKSSQIRARKNRNANINNAKRRAQRATDEYNKKYGTNKSMKEYTQDIQRTSEYQQERYEVAEFLRNNGQDVDMGELMNNMDYYLSLRDIASDILKDNAEDMSAEQIQGDVERAFTKTEVDENGRVIVVNALTGEVVYEYD